MLLKPGTGLPLVAGSEGANRARCGSAVRSEMSRAGALPCSKGRLNAAGSSTRLYVDVSASWPAEVAAVRVMEGGGGSGARIAEPGGARIRRSASEELSHFPPPFLRREHPTLQ